MTPNELKRRAEGYFSITEWMLVRLLMFAYLVFDLVRFVKFLWTRV